MKNYTKYPSAHLTEFKIEDGLQIISGSPHGLNWKPIWEVAVWFETQEEAEEFMASLQEGGIVEPLELPDE